MSSPQTALSWIPLRRGEGPIPGASGKDNGWSKDQRYTGNNGTKCEPAVDTPDRFESFLLGEGEQKVEVEPETRE